jgi:tetratricopeptide (TPR) repeat protein
MPTLRLTQTTLGQDEYRVEVALVGEEIPRRSASAQFPFTFTDQERERLRWYVEDYLEHPFEPAPTIAARIEQEMQAIGARLFGAVFAANNDTRRLWNRAVDALGATRVEIVTDVVGATELPWELLFDPDMGAHLSLQAKTFVRTHEQSIHTPPIPQTESGEPIRILLVICRPGGRADVPFRSVASRIVKGLSAEARQVFDLDVLRPPTFERLAEALRAAKDAGQPYHVVHFDGHGAFLNVQRLFEALTDEACEEEMARLLNDLVNLAPNRFSPEAIYPGERREGKRGYLVFENPKIEPNLRLVDGPEMGKLLAETGVPVLVLNACRSAHAEAPPAPTDAGEDGSDIHAQVRAFGSLAQEVMDAGVAGVVAMRYNVYVVTAAQFVADLYAALTQGHTLGQAATQGRKQLHAQPLRAIAYDARPLQDWPVPVVYEAAPIPLFPRPAQETGLHVPLEAGDAAATTGRLDPSLPPIPDAGFFGRDETLLALDRAFDTQSIVLLHAYAGSGKTATAAEFARWYALTGGVEGAVLFTSFEQYKPLPRVLDEIERVFGPVLERSGIHWLALDDDQRQEVALQVLVQIPVLWIWDNVEPVAGFPAGSDSAWSATEQRALADFLRAAQETRARFLLTSRRDERAWLGDLPARVTLPPMPLRERVQLARALAEKHGHRLSDADVAAWRPLLEFTRGNPLTITVVVGQALRDGLRAEEQIAAFVAQLRTGEAQIEDEESAGRTRSLAASLNYGFEHAFDEQERKQLALLHLFQGFVDVNVLRQMGALKAITGEDYSLDAVRGLTRGQSIRLLDRAAEVGLLTAHGGGAYTIHPALPWYFKGLFDQYYPSAISGKGPGEGEGMRATRAFVEAMGALGNHYHKQYERGNRDVITALAAEEANLLHAWQLARADGWWDAVISTMQGLSQFYSHTGRRAEWRRLVEEILPNFVDLATNDPLPGREGQWDLITQYRVQLLIEARQWTEAERLLRIQVEQVRQLAVTTPAQQSEELDSTQRNMIRSLATSLHALGRIQLELGQEECVESYKESLILSEKIDERTGVAACALNLGNAYKNISAIRDLDQAERWYRRSLDLLDERDRLGRGKGLITLGIVAYERFQEARTANESEEDLLRHFNAAAQFYHQALTLLPSDAADDRALVHNALGTIYDAAGHLDDALPHYRESIRYLEAAGDLYHAAGVRFNVAVTLVRADRLEEAQAYAHAALGNFSTYGPDAADMVQRMQGLIAQIERLVDG